MPEGRERHDAKMKTLCIELGLPWHDGSVESLDGKLSDELPAHAVFGSPRVAKMLRRHRWKNYRTGNPFSPLGYRLPKLRSYRGQSRRCIATADSIDPIADQD